MPRRGVRLSAACEGGPGTITGASGRRCLGTTQAAAATGQCVDGHARNCYSDHPVGTASQRPSDCRRRLSSRAICPEQSFGHPAPTPAVVVCARSLLENGIARAKSQCGQFTRTFVRLGCTSISSKAGLVGSREQSLVTRRSVVTMEESYMVTL